MKRMVIYGDSISTGTHGAGGYQPALTKGLGLKQVWNFAVGGSGLSPETPDNLLSILREKPVPPQAELVLIWHGTNDWYWGAPLASFEASIAEAVALIRRQVPLARLVWLTPIYRFQAPDRTEREGNAHITLNIAGHTLSDYRDILERQSKQWGFFLLEIDRMCDLHTQNEHLFYEDRVHPNRAGYERLEQVIVRECKRWAE